MANRPFFSRRFVRAKPNGADYIYLLVSIILALIFIFNQIISQSLSAYGAIYTPIAILAVAIFGVAFISKGKGLAVVIFGDIRNNLDLGKQILIGLAIGIPLFIIIAIGISLTGLAFVPLTVGGTSSVASISLAFIVAFLAVEIEDTFFQGILIPTLATGFQYSYAITIVTFIGGVVFTGLYPVYIIGGISFLISFIFFMVEVLKRKKIKFGVGANIMSAIIIGALVWALFHAWADQSHSNLLLIIIDIAIFGILFGIINGHNGSTITSRIIHSLNNLAVLFVAFGIGLLAVILVAVVYVFYEFMMWNAHIVIRKHIGRAMVS